MSPLFQRIFGGSTRPSSPASTTGEAAPAASEPTASEPPPVDGSILHDELRDAVVACMRDLDEMLIERDHRSPDVVRLLRAVRDDPVGGIRELPSAAQRAMFMLHGDASIKALIQVFEQDPALTQALLRTANTAFYNPSGTRIMSITDAINRMGRVGLQGVIFEQALSGMVSRPGGALDTMASQVWNHMVRTAPLARQLARAFEVVPDEGFLLGLLHDVGKLVIFDRITALRGAQRQLLAIDAKVISQMLRHLHEPLGGYVMLEWGLEPDFGRAIATHHREPPPPVRDRMCELTYLAERVELAQTRKQEPDLEAIWREGGLAGDRAAAAKALEIKALT